MKAILLCTCFILLYYAGKTQLTNGGIYANFGVDGDTRAGFNKYGQSQGIASGDDWFYPVSNGFSIIDTSNASVYKSLLFSGKNIGFTKRMNVPLYSKLGNTLWLDGVYSRDYSAVNSFMDSTGFTIACKNGDNPGNWVGGTTSTPNKNDLIDVFAHMRRDGLNVHDSLWLFTAVSTIGTSGSRYFDVELYKKSLGYNYINGQFTTAGTDAGHTQWLFDAAGNIFKRENKLHIFKTVGINEITVQSSVTEKSVLAVYSTDGSLIFNKNIQLQPGNNTVPVQLSCWKNKELLLVVFTGNEKTVQRIIY